MVSQDKISMCPDPRSWKMSTEKDGDELFQHGKDALAVPDVPAATKYFSDAAAVSSSTATQIDG